MFTGINFFIYETQIKDITKDIQQKRDNKRETTKDIQQKRQQKTDNKR
jgi:hypothetical protein